jgi:hypothetical protein
LQHTIRLQFMLPAKANLARISLIVLASVIMIVNYNSTVITIVNYNRKTLILHVAPVQATVIPKRTISMENFIQINFNFDAKPEF